MSLEKPVVFFSHSSRDKVALKKLKERFDDLTGGTVDVFLSSDGQSIKLGSNWVSSIENALKAAKIMFVFVSPNSLNTPWLYFETGHAYSKEISVVPVGLFGVDIGKLSPPMNLLQGFNLTDADSMNNIIAKVNEVFATKHKLAFTKEDFGALNTEASALGQQVLGSHVATVESVRLNIRVAGTTMDRVKRLLLATDNCFERPQRNQASHPIGWSTLDLPGARATIEPLQKRIEGKLHATEPTGVSNISFLLDPTAIDITFPVVEAAIAQALVEEPSESPNGYWCSIVFNSLVRHVQTSHKQMARLRDFKLAPLFQGNSNVQFSYDDMTFQVDWEQQGQTSTGSRIALVRPTLTPYCKSGLGDLINLLFERGILYYGD